MCYVIIAIVILILLVVWCCSSKKEGYYSMSGWSGDMYQKCSLKVAKSNPNCKKCYSDGVKKCGKNTECLKKHHQYSTSCGLCDFNIRSNCGASGYFGTCC